MAKVQPLGRLAPQKLPAISAENRISVAPNSLPGQNALLGSPLHVGVALDGQGQPGVAFSMRKLEQYHVSSLTQMDGDAIKKTR